MSSKENRDDDDFSIELHSPSVGEPGYRAPVAPSKHTPGPWAWFGNASSNSIYLATTHSGRRYVMDFVRWGMRGAQPRFQPARGGMIDAKDLVKFEVGDGSVVGVEAAKKDGSVYRYDIRGINCADACLIAAAPDLLEACRCALGQLTGNMDGDMDLGDPCEMLRAAIAKAEGHQ